MDGRDGRRSLALVDVRMKIFGWLLRKRDPACEWVADATVATMLDLDRPALCGIALGSPIHSISRLGRPANDQPTREGSYVYRDRGFVIDCSAQVVTGFTVYLGPSSSRYGMSVFQGPVVHAGEPATLSTLTQLSEFCSRFGDPYWTDTDGAETLLFYEYGEVEWQAEFDNRGQLQVLTIVTPPLLSKQDQRAAYRVTKAWPPG